MTNPFLDESFEFQDEENLFEPEPEEAGRHAAPVIADRRFDMAKKILRQMQENLESVIALLENPSSDSKETTTLAQLVTAKKEMEKHLEDISGSHVVEGVFDGQQMVGSDGRRYSVPPNYASKSRLVEGDILKLTIRSDGTFLFKQISPMERRRLVGLLAFDASAGNHVVLCGEQRFHVLQASVTYYRGELGDEAVILVPKTTPSVWAAVENIVKK
jgi:hypothetical protein